MKCPFKQIKLESNVTTNSMNTGGCNKIETTISVVFGFCEEHECMAYIDQMCALVKK